MPTVDELEEKKEVLQKKADKISKMIGSCSKAVLENACGDLIRERSKIMFEISKINDEIIKNEKKERMRSK